MVPSPEPGGKKQTPPPPPPTGVCLVVAGGLTQDLTLILSTNKTPNKTKQRKEKPKQESIYYKRSGEGFIAKKIYCALLTVTASNNILENANCEEDMLCVTTAELHEELQDEDMLCFTASLIVKKI